jgi:starvation-inducible DNA-binding protein
MTIAANAKTAIAETLAHLLADTYTLAFKTHGYHWNVVGPHFPMLHTLFGDQYAALYLAADEIAERIRALGVKAPSSYAAYAKLTSIPVEEDAGMEEYKMVEALRDAHLEAAKSAYKVVEIAEAHKDVGSADLATARIQEHEKAAWMLTSLLG